MENTHFLTVISVNLHLQENWWLSHRRQGGWLCQ